MAKTYSKKAPASKKVTKAELEQLRDFISKLNTALTEIGDIELRKHKLLHALDLTEKDYASFQTVMKEKYGDIKINPQDGSIISNLELIK